MNPHLFYMQSTCSPRAKRRLFVPLGCFWEHVTIQTLLEVSGMGVVMAPA